VEKENILFYRYRFALSGKKTVIIGCDLRKPKLFDEFNLSNEVGIVNYLIKQKSLDVINHTQIPHLDVILSGRFL
jgi:Mrp family chromosome partitioning ATPase